MNKNNNNQREEQKRNIKSYLDKCNEDLSEYSYISVDANGTVCAWSVMPTKDDREYYAENVWAQGDFFKQLCRLYSGEMNLYQISEILEKKL